MGPKKSDIKKIVDFLKSSKMKYVSLDSLSSELGIYDYVLEDQLVAFDPMAKFDHSINVRDLLPEMEKYLEVTPSKEAPKKEEKKEGLDRVIVPSRLLYEYKSVNDFILKKMTTVGGLLDTATSLEDKDLYVLRKLIELELYKRKKDRSKYKKRGK